jgi:hypothetical protein
VYGQYWKWWLSIGNGTNEENALIDRKVT